jgi:hypothetical protein
MKWDEFAALLKGISPDTPLGKIVEIRSEDNKDTLKHFTKQQHKIRNDWRRRCAKKVQMDKKTFDEAMKAWENVFASMTKG